jgi:tyrosinase
MKHLNFTLKRMLLLGCLLFTFLLMHAQRIRKDHREMTPGEKQAYTLALNQLFAIGTITDMANHHASHFESEIHTRGNPINGTQFLPWHRVFQLELEQKLRAAGTLKAAYITIPFWDWRIENTTANVTWDDNGFLSPAFVSPWGVTRGLGGATIANNTNISQLLALTGAILPSSWQAASPTSSFFSKRLEHWHNLGHVFVGGTMNQTNSPLDPIFYLHHGFVDKLWQEWEEKENAVQSVFPATELIHYNLINPNSIVDSRITLYQEPNNNIVQQDVWYAYNRKLLLDGLNGNFNVTGAGKLYCYVAWNGSSVEGTIYSGDVVRDGSDNVINDNKGGFVVTSGSSCDFRAGKEIFLKPGFTVQQGASFTASLVSLPCGFTSNTSAGKSGFPPPVARSIITKVSGISEEPIINSTKTQVFPNPFVQDINIQFSIKQSAIVRVEILNNLGQSIAVLMPDGKLNTGNHTIKWKPNSNISSGVYYCIIQTNSFKEVIKLVYAR